MKIEGIPEGYEVVRWGKPMRGEWWLTDSGAVSQSLFDCEKAHALIVRKLEPVLDVSKIRLKKGWVAQDSTGRTYWYECRPRLTSGEWFSNSRDLSRIDETHIIPWREDVPWTERIMEVGE